MKHIVSDVKTVCGIQMSTINIILPKSQFAAIQIKQLFHRIIVAGSVSPRIDQLALTILILEIRRHLRIFVIHHEIFDAQIINIFYNSIK